MHSQAIFAHFAVDNPSAPSGTDHSARSHPLGEQSRSSCATGSLADRGQSLADVAQLVVDGYADAGLLPSDLALVRDAHAKRFGP